MFSRLSKAAILGLLTGIAGVIVGLLPAVVNLDEYVGLEFLFKLRGKRQPPSDVVVVSIDRESSDNLNLPDNPDKWPRSFHARLIENLSRAGAEAIAFDVHFIELRSPEDDQVFARAIRDARNVVLCEPLKAKEIPAAGAGTSDPDVFSIVKIVKPPDLFAEPALATAPFVLPRIPFKVSQYWTFQTGAGDSPTMPAVVFQLFTLPVYGEFIRLLERASPNRARELPRYQELQTKALKGLVRRIRAIFESEPLLADTMLRELENSQALALDAKKQQLVRSLIELYQSPNSRYINYYGPPRTITTIPYYQALQLNNGASGGNGIDLKGKVVVGAH